MKKTTWKKIVSFVLVAALVISVAHFGNTNVKAGEVGTPTATLNVTGNSLEPTLSFSINAPGDDDYNYVGKRTDIVLVVDLSGSMLDDGKLDKVKTASKAFCDQLLTGKTAQYTKIAVASYGRVEDTVIGLTGSDGLANIKNRIDSMTISSDPYDKERGTNIQGGIRAAEKILGSSDAVNKIIVLLSDGKATYSYKTEEKWERLYNDPSGLTNTGSDNDYTYYTDSEGNVYRKRNKTGRHYYKQVIEETIYGNGSESQDSWTLNAIKEATKEEAKKANESYNIVTISYGDKADTELMSALAKDKKTYVSDSDAITETLKKIGKDEITGRILAGSDAYIEGDLGDEIISNGDLPEGVVINGKKIKWTIGDLDGNYSTEPIPLKVNADIDTLAKKYHVDANGTITIPVSSNAMLYYNDKNGAPQTKPVNNTNTITLQINNIVKWTVKYESEQLDGTFTEIQKASYVEYAPAGQTVTADRKSVKDLGIGSYYNEPDYDKVSVNNNVITVKAYLRTATVTYMIRNEKGAYSEYDVSDPYKYGTTITVGEFENIPSYFTYDNVATETSEGEADTYENAVEHPFAGTWTIGEETIDDGDEDIVDAALVYYANYDNVPAVVNKSVTFIANGEPFEKFTGVIGESIEEKIAALQDPEDWADKKYQYTFKHWSLEEDGEAVKDLASKIPSENVIYYAVFNKTEIPYYVTYVIDGKEIGKQLYSYEELFTEDAGYKAIAENKAVEKSSVSATVSFIGWNTDDENITSDGKVIGNATVVGRFSEPQYHYCTITYLNEDKSFYDSDTVLKGTKAIDVKGAPAKNNDADYIYSFDGWYDEQDNTLASLIGNGVLDDITVIAKFNEHKIAKGTLSFYAKEFEEDTNELFIDPIVYTEFTTLEELTAMLPQNTPDKDADENYTYDFDNWYTYVDSRTLVQDEVMSLAAAKTGLTSVSLDEFLDAYVPGVVVDLGFYPEYSATEIPAKPAPKDTWTVIYKLDNEEISKTSVEVEKDVDYSNGFVAKKLSEIDSKYDDSKYEYVNTASADKTITVDYKTKKVEETPKEEVAPKEEETAAPEVPVAPTTTETPSTPVSVVYTLTIEYIFEDGTSAAAPAVRYLSAGDSYSIASPDVDGYTAGLLVVTGTMPESDKVITVVYTKAAEPAEPEEVVDDIVANETPEGTPDEDVKEEEESIAVENKGTPEGTPDEDDEDEEDEPIDVDLVGTPEGLPATGTAPVAVFFGIGAACIIFGGAMIVKIRRREEEM